jgi:hypothetical protein
MLRTFRNRLWKNSVRYSSGKFSNLPKDLEPEETVDFDLTVEYPGDFEIALDKIREETTGMDKKFSNLIDSKVLWQFFPYPKYG